MAHVFQYPQVGRGRMVAPAASGGEYVPFKPEEVKWKCTKEIESSMPIATKQENTAFQIQPHPICHVCAASKEEVQLSCANFDCDHKMHASCASRPEGTRLHFCSLDCVLHYADR